LEHLTLALHAAQNIGVVDAVKGAVCERKSGPIRSQHAAAIVQVIAHCTRASDAQAGQWEIGDHDLAARRCGEKQGRPARAGAEFEQAAAARKP
jgi:hypothetical protein